MDNRSGTMDSSPIPQGHAQRGRGTSDTPLPKVNAADKCTDAAQGRCEVKIVALHTTLIWENLEGLGCRPRPCVRVCPQPQKSNEQATRRAPLARRGGAGRASAHADRAQRIVVMIVVTSGGRLKMRSKPMCRW
eukprot:1877135-Prymnesium_polylepis.1